MQSEAHSNLVLVVDDERSLATIVCDLLTDAGYEAIPAGNGEEALAILARRRPCIILLDLMMPVMNGWKFLETLALDEKQADIPVLVTSAAPDLGDSVSSHPFLRKPFTMECLLATVATVCRPVSIA